MPLSDIDCLTVLDALHARATLPDGCDTQVFVSEGLIENVGDRWELTVKGRLYLANLRTMQRQEMKQG